MIGCYVHHVGRGHRSRATAIAAALDEPVVGLSTLPRPANWRGEWIELPADDDGPAPVDADAGGRLHWAPLGHAGLRARMARIAGWIDAAAPRALVVDVSVEVALLARLHGVPVVTIAMPGDRRDPAHELGYAISTAVIGCWPPEARGLLDAAAADRVHAVGGISRFAPARGAGLGAGGRVLVFGGAGGDGFTADAVGRARASAPDWSWQHLGSSGSWSDDPWAALTAADVVVTHAGESAIAEVAAARRPAIVIPQPRPHDEQLRTAAVLAEGPWPVIALPELPADGWPQLLERAAALDGERWGSWDDGGGAARAAAVIAAAAGGAAR